MQVFKDFIKVSYMQLDSRTAGRMLHACLHIDRVLELMAVSRSLKSVGDTHQMAKAGGRAHTCASWGAPKAQNVPQAASCLLSPVQPPAQRNLTLFKSNISKPDQLHRSAFSIQHSFTPRVCAACSRTANASAHDCRRCQDKPT